MKPARTLSYYLGMCFAHDAHRSVHDNHGQNSPLQSVVLASASADARCKWKL